MASKSTSNDLHAEKKLTLLALTWPIFVELALHMLMGNIDTFMLSQYNDHAVASVGVANQLMSMVQIMFGFVAAGTTILVSRYLGAKQLDDAHRVAATSLTLNLIFGLVLSAVLVLLSGNFLRMMGLEQDLIPDAQTFINITGSFMFIQALLLTVSAVIKSHGFTRNVMLITVGMNILNIIGNAITINGWFGMPVLGVAGVASSTVISRIMGLAFMTYFLFSVLRHPLQWPDLIRPARKHIRDLLRIGVPSAGEQLSYNTSQLVITGFIATLGTAAMVTRVYTFNIIYLITIFSLAVGQGTQILVARMVGAKNLDEAYRTCMRSLGIGMLISFVMAGFYNLVGGYILDWFTDDQEVIRMGRQLLLLAFILEPGRAFNLIIISALRSAGDVKFPVYVGVTFMWGFAVPIAYMLGIYFGLGLMGIFVAFIVDEWVRGLIMLHRWRMRKWQGILAGSAKPSKTLGSTPA